MSATKRPAAGERGRAEEQNESDSGSYHEGNGKQQAHWEKKLNAKDADSGKIALEIRAHYTINGASRIRYWGGLWLVWLHGRFVELSEPELRAIIVRYMRPNWSHIKREHVANVIENLRAEIMLPSGLSPPAWIGNPIHGFNATECLATATHVIHLPSWADKMEPCNLPATPNFFTLSASDFDIEQLAPPPEKWLSFIKELWPNDQESIDTLQEIFGYMLTADTRQQKIFGLFGPPRSGKGTIIKILSKVIGDRNVAGPTLSSIATQFGLAQLVGKTLAIVSDARLSRRTDLASVLEHLLSVSGEDPQTIDRKHLPAIHCRLGVRFLIASNELPQLPDASGAIVTRFVLLRTMKTFLGKEDTELEKKLSAELHGILLWAIEGWKRLRARGHFIQPAAGKEMLSRMTELASPVMAFVGACCELAPEAMCPKSELYRAFRAWCASENIERVPTHSQFTRNLAAAYSEIDPDVRPRTEAEAGRPRCYGGIRLRVAPARDEAGF